MAAGHIRPARTKDGAAGRAWVICWRDAAGTQHSHTVHGRKGDAQRQLTQERAQADRGAAIATGKQTVAKYLEEWLRDYVEPRLAAQTARSYRQDVTRLSRHIGQHRLDRLTGPHIQAAYRKLLEENLSEATVRHCHAVLHRALRQAVRSGLLHANPAEATDPPTIPRREARVLAREQALLILEAAYQDRLGLPVILALGLGLRAGECLGLRWEDVTFGDGVEGMVRVRQALVRDTREMARPKGGRQRAVSLPEFVAIALRAHLAKQTEMRTTLGSEWNAQGLVCCGPAGRQLSSNLWRAMTRICTAAGVPRVNFHALRHSHASLLLGDGASIREVSERLGHATPSITLNVYAHVLPGMQEKTARRLQDLLG